MLKIKFLFKQNENFTCWVSIHDRLQISCRLLSLYEHLKTYSLNTNATGCNCNLDSRNTLQIKKVQWAYSQKTLYITFLVKISNFFPIEAERVNDIIHTQTQRVCFMHVPKMMLEIQRTHLLEIHSAAIYLIVNINSFHIFSWTKQNRGYLKYIYDFYEFDSSEWTNLNQVMKHYNFTI